MNISIIKVDEKIADLAIGVQNTIFPKESGDFDILQASQGMCPQHQFLQEYYIGKVGDKPFGIVGLYAYNNYPKDAWLGWFGVLPEERGNGYGKILFEFAKQKSKELGFENLRLYTDELDNLIATKFYDKQEMIKEEYINTSDTHLQISKTLIYSLSLTDKNVSKWENKYLYLDDHEKRNS